MAMVTPSSTEQPPIVSGAAPLPGREGRETQLGGLTMSKKKCHRLSPNPDTSQRHTGSLRTTKFMGDALEECVCKVVVVSM